MCKLPPCPLPYLRTPSSRCASARQYNDTEAASSVKLAVQAGFTHIDTAYDYHNQRGVGAGLADSALARSKLFITTKVHLPV